MFCIITLRKKPPPQSVTLSPSRLNHATFTISADNLNAWFAHVSPDCLGLPRYGYGDLRRVEAGFFASHARSAWGLEQIGYPIHLDGYKFEIINEGQFEQWGFARYGTVDEE